MSKRRNFAARPSTSQDSETASAAGRGSSIDQAKADPGPPKSAALRRAEEIRHAGYRETVESIAVAIILALLFRAFVAEAFVIPTGSMAPALMGAHKDLFCSQCGAQFQASASIEDKTELGRTVVGAICENCRFHEPLDLANTPGHATFSGDRILVSKFAYSLSNPDRWDVAVFKFPGNPKQNYIKRIVGLPNETLMIHHGDIYVKAGTADAQQATIANRDFEIQRKPADKLLAMRHHVFDTRLQPQALNQAKYPHQWQPWQPNASSPPTDSWQLSVNEEGLRAEITTKDDREHWIRYFHRPASVDLWAVALNGGSLAEVDPYASGLITDFYAYNTFLNVPARRVYENAGNDEMEAGGSRLTQILPRSSGQLVSQYRSGDLAQYAGEISVGTYNTAAEGLHWVGDLIFEADVETSADSQSLRLEIVEAGLKHLCVIDLTSGKATLSLRDDQERAFSAQGKESTAATAETAVRAGGRHTLRFSNADDQLLLWIDDELISFDSPTTYDHRSFRSADEDRPQYSAQHPLDAAPVGLAVVGGQATVHHLKIDRDKYYIATKQTFEGLNDYDMDVFMQQTEGRSPPLNTSAVFWDRDRWDRFAGWKARRTVVFKLEADQFFPLGDNSPESKDARCWVDPRNRFGSPDPYAYHWADVNYVPRDLLVGKALMVFWPHPWNEPFPYTPNFKRIGLIR